jgi:hypothetical protein
MHHQQAGYRRRFPRTVEAVTRLIVFVVAAVVLLVVLWLMFWSLIHGLILAFWIVLVVLLGIGLFRVSRWSSRSGRSR